jgi:hypothetical protein
MNPEGILACKISSKKGKLLVEVILSYSFHKSFVNPWFVLFTCCLSSGMLCDDDLDNHLTLREYPYESTCASCNHQNHCRPKTEIYKNITNFGAFYIPK